MIKTNTFKRTMFVMIFVFLVALLMAAGTENFSNIPASSSSYAARSWTGTDGGTWTAVGSRTDQTLTGKCICFTTGNVTSPSYSGGMGVLTFSYVRAFTGSGARTLRVYVNNVQQGANITVSTTSDVVQTYNATLNISGDVILKIASDTAGQIKVDEISWSSYGSATPSTVLSPATLSGFSYIVGSGPSATQNFNVSGSNLTGNINISAPAHYEIKRSDYSTFKDTLVLIPSGGVVTDKTINIRLKSGLSSAVYNNENVTIATNGAADKTVTCKGYIYTSTPSNLLLEENFNYASGTLLSDIGWNAHSGGGTFPPNLTSPGLSYPNYPSVAGNCAQTINNGEDDSKNFTIQTSGVVYCSFLINVASTIEAGDYIFHFSTNPAVSDFKGKFFVGKDTSNNVKFGITKSANTGTSVVWTGLNYALNTTYLVVLKYSILPDLANDVVSAWINPDFSGPEPAPLLTAISTETDIAAGIGSVAIRQSNALITAKFDGIRVANAWYKLFDQVVVPPNVTTNIDGVGVESSIVLYYNDTLPITDPSIPYLPYAGNLENPIVIIFTAPLGSTDIVLTVGEGTWYAVAYYNGAWQKGSQYPLNGAGEITFTNVPFGAKADVPVIIGNGGDPTLPVELSSFTATATAQNYVMLSWTTQSETGVSGFYIYRNNSENLSNATRIPSLIEATNTSSEASYVFTDQEVEGNGTWYYWLQNVDMSGQSNFHGPISVILTGDNGNNPTPVIPVVTELKGIYPNPFSTMSIVSYNLAKAANVTLDIYNVRGEKVRSLLSTSKSAGTWRAAWNGNDNNGNACTSGMYYVKMSAGKYTSTQKVVLMK